MWRKDLEVSVRAIILISYLIESDLISERMIFFIHNKISDVMSCQKDQYLAQNKLRNCENTFSSKILDQPRTSNRSPDFNYRLKSIKS